VNHEGFVLRGLRHRRAATALSTLAVALGVALVIAVDGLRREARARFEGAAGSWDLVVGPKGDPLRNVLATLFHLGDATGTLPEATWRALAADPRVERAVPWAVGDSYEGFRVVGTTADLLGAEARRGVPIRLAAGAPFAPFDPARPSHEAILGATAAAATGMGPGATFTAEHGLDEGAEGAEHDEAPWRVAGVLAPTGTPMDRVILVPLEAFWSMEGHDAAAGKGEERQVSAVLVRTRSPLHARLLFGEIRASADAQPAFPFLEVRKLFDLVGHGDRILLAVAALVVAVAALGILVSMMSSMHERRRDIAVMRALGARRGVVAGLVVGEAAAVGAMGAVAGFLLGHGATAVAAARLAEWTGVPLRPFAVAPEELLVVVGAILLCAAAALVPAAAAWRVEVGENLE
jgi:putative ABC transport system permease protein